MKSLPSEYIFFVERILREHPDRQRELQALEKTIEACCRCGCYSDVKGSRGSPEPERVLEAKEGNKTYTALSRIVHAVEKSVTLLDEKEKQVIELLCWEGLPSWEVAEQMATEDRWIRKLKRRACLKLASTLLRPWVLEDDG